MSSRGFIICASLLLTVSGLTFSGCASSLLKYDFDTKSESSKEFQDAIKIEKPVVAEVVETEEPEVIVRNGQLEVVKPEVTEAILASPALTEPVKAAKTPEKKSVKDTLKTDTLKKDNLKKDNLMSDKSVAAKNGKSIPIVAEKVPMKRQPELEDSEGFDGRRPVVDPFREGEVVTHDVNYFKVSAGELRMKVEPFATVNGKKSYSFAAEIKTKALFNTFYRVEDRVETFVDFEDLLPRAFALYVNESGQAREARMAFDLENKKATFWERKVKKGQDPEEKKQEWTIPEYTQNVYSAIFYLRNFKWEVGKEYSFRVANDGDNLVFSAKAIRKEVLKTKLGPMNAIVIQPNISLKGKFKSIGDNYIWLSDDDRKYIIRIESKIKIGTLVSEVVSIKPGK